MNTVVVVTLGTARQAQVEEDVLSVLAEGGTVQLVVTKADPWAALPAEVRRHPIGDREGRHPLLRAERFLVLRLPRLVYEVVRRVLSALGRITPGRPGRFVKRAQGSWKRRWIGTRERTTRFHKERWGPTYGKVRPFVLWRTARKHVLRQLPAPDLIIVADGLSSPIGWQLARRYPAAGVGFSLAEAQDDRDRRRESPADPADVTG